MKPSPEGRLHTCPPSDHRHLLARLSAVRIHGPPGPVELPGVDRLSCRPAFQQDRPHGESYYDIERDALSGAYLSPVRCNAVRSSEGAKAVSGHGGTCPPLRCYRARGRMGARVMASGMPGASRRAVLGGAHLFGCKGVGSGFAGPHVPRQRHISATSLARVQRGGVNPGHCARGFGAMSLWPVSDWPVGRRLNIALRGSIAQTFLGVSRTVFARNCSDFPMSSPLAWSR